jgi:hypothetical protein
METNNNIMPSAAKAKAIQAALNIEAMAAS